MLEEEGSHAAEDPHTALIEAFTKALTSVKVSPTDALKPPKFDWNSHDQYEDFRLFQRGMESWYKLQGITEKEGDDTQLEYLLNFLGLVGWKKHKQWTPDGATPVICAKAKKSATEFMKFLHCGMDHPVSQHCRIYQLEEISIKADETPDELVDRIRGLADRCNFPTDVEKEWHIQFRLVHALSDTDLVRKLLAMKMEAITAEMLATCHTHITIADNMLSMGLATKTVNAIQKVPKKSQCGNCTKPHAPGWQHCPAKDSMCHSCQRVGHWRVKCRKSKRTAPGSKKTPNPQQLPRHRPGGKKKVDEVGVSEGHPHYDEISINA